MQTIDDNLHKVTARIAQSALAAGRKASDIQLLAVSKGQTATALEIAYRAGQRRFGENYLQESLDKILALAHLPDIEWHFIGPIQANKTRAIAQNFDWVHSIDRLKIAQRLNAQRPSTLPALQVCVQVNIDDESSKSGVTLAELPGLVQQLVDLSNLRVRGLMAIPAPSDRQQITGSFRRLAEAYADLKTRGFHRLDTLSMGMSADLEPAIAQGATIVRVGTDIFGPRPGKAD